jgi:hypothetical protein
MRIIIEIDSREAAATTIYPRVTGEALPQVSDESTTPAGIQIAMPEAITDAAALEATDAGPAPNEIAASEVPITPLTGQDALETEVGDMDADAAPASPPDVSPEGKDE